MSSAAKFKRKKKYFIITDQILIYSNRENLLSMTFIFHIIMEYYYRRVKRKLLGEAYMNDTIR